MILAGKRRKRNNALMVNLEKLLFGEMGFADWETRPELPFEKSARPLPAGWQKIDGGRA